MLSLLPLIQNNVIHFIRFFYLFIYWGRGEVIIIEDEWGRGRGEVVMMGDGDSGSNLSHEHLNMYKHINL